MQKIFMPDEDREFPKEVKNKPINIPNLFWYVSLAILFISIFAYIILGGNGLLFLIWLVISIMPIILIKSKKWRIFTFLASIFLFCQFILLPLIYATILNRNPNSFEVDTFIQSEEAKSAYIDIIEKYEPEKGKYAIRLIDTVLKNNDARLENYFTDEIESTGEYSLGSLKIKARQEEGFILIELNTTENVTLRTFTNTQISKFDFHMLSVADVLNGTLEALKTEQTQYQAEINRLRKNQIWNYSRILPYSVNMIGVSNLIPKTRLANVIYTIQSYLMNSILFGIIISAVYQFIIDKSTSKTEAKAEIKN